MLTSSKMTQSEDRTSKLSKRSKARPLEPKPSKKHSLPKFKSRLINYPKGNISAWKNWLKFTTELSTTLDNTPENSPPLVDPMESTTITLNREDLSLRPNREDTAIEVFIIYEIFTHLTSYIINIIKHI